MRTYVLVWTLSAALFAQQPAKVDFRRDVQPIFQANCVGCHGPALQMNGFRLDRRSAGSRLYLKLLDNRYGAPGPETLPCGGTVFPA